MARFLGWLKSLGTEFEFNLAVRLKIGGKKD